MDLIGKTTGEESTGLAQETPPGDVTGPGAAGKGPSPVIADGSIRSLEPANIRAESIAWWVLTGCVSASGLVTLVIVCATGGTLLWVLMVAAAWATITGALALASVRWPRLTHRHTSYIVSPLGLEIRRGVVWRTVVNVPRSRVQHTDVTQGPIMRRFGLATLTIHTAGTQQAAVSLEGLAHPTALSIRDFLVSGGPGDGV